MPAPYGRKEVLQMSLYDVWADRETENAIVITFRNWTEIVLYDSRKTLFDIPLELAGYPIESVTVDDDLTIIEI
jgi:hypothetical protein